ncbi:MAG: methyltransferase domain-containing protein [Oscillatoriales cyanobacterium RM2_1_1]|nr:methyltransferase domain-containing protein [Oscillatoriales cyanobacterium SM2_3_0]NJO45534.1 methyltransferase domain-containing protein [Oscillatoriales cyanobacterium RM2_1_1]
MEDISAAVKQLYDTYPFPPDPLSNEPPPGYNWRWCWPTAYSFCTGQAPQDYQIRILDAGCGTGSSTEYLIKLNSRAAVLGIDLSDGAIKMARERCSQSGICSAGTPEPEFQRLSLYDVTQLAGQFDLINCVGVLHHLPDPIRGLRNLAVKLAPGGLMHIFVYAELGRREIRLMQEAIALLQGNRRGNYQDGVKTGRQMFAALPPENPLAKYESSRWAMENQRDECFADMYVHPQEIDYNIQTLFELIEASGLEFIGFSNPNYWQLDRLLGQAPELLERAAELSDMQRYRLIELLDPQLSHYEFFLGRPPLPLNHWSEEESLLNAIPQVSPCLNGWPSQTLFDPDYKLITLSDDEFQFMQACEVNLLPGEERSPDLAKTVRDILVQAPLDLETVRSLQTRQLILLTPE